MENDPELPKDPEQAPEPDPELSVPFVPTNETDYLTATSYISLESGEVFMQGSPLSEKWAEYKENKKKALLIESSMCLDALYDYAGSKTDKNQILEFPRNGDLVIPSRIEMAMKLALELVILSTGEGNITSMRAGDHSIKYSFAAKFEKKRELLAFLKPLKLKYRIKYQYGKSR